MRNILLALAVVMLPAAAAEPSSSQKPDKTLSSGRVLPPQMFDLLAPRGTEWDSPMIGEPFATADVPGPDVYNLRRKRNGRPEIDLDQRRAGDDFFSVLSRAREL